MAWQSMDDFSKALDEALAPAMQGALDRAKAQEIISAARTGGIEEAKKVAATMTPDQAARVARHLDR